MSAGVASADGPCDIFAAAGTPCVAAHSMVRALFGSYNGNLYQVKRADGATADVPVLSAGGIANAAAQDSFCGTQACVVQRIYDQVRIKSSSLHMQQVYFVRRAFATVCSFQRASVV